MKNKEIYIKNYSIEYLLPTFNVMNAMYLTQDPRYVFQLIKIVQPKDGQKVYFHDLKGDHVKKSY